MSSSRDAVDMRQLFSPIGHDDLECLHTQRGYEHRQAFADGLAVGNAGGMAHMQAKAGRLYRKTGIRKHRRRSSGKTIGQQNGAAENLGAAAIRRLQARQGASEIGRVEPAGTRFEDVECQRLHLGIGTAQRLAHHGQRFARPLPAGDDPLDQLERRDCIALALPGEDGEELVISFDFRRCGP